MKTFPRSAALLLALGLAPFASAEPGHKFPAVTGTEIARIGAALPPKPADAPAKPRKLLVFYRTEGFVHDSIPVANETLRRMGEKTGAWSTTITDDMAFFEPAKLAQFDAVAFVSTTQLAFENPVYRKALLDFVESGKGLVGIHAATDNFPTWPEGQALIGGCFHSHPWLSSQTVSVKLDEPDHILDAAFEKRGFRIRDEIYRMKAPYSRDAVRVLVSLDMSKAENRRPKAGVTGTDGDFGISWIRTAGKGRVFYSSLGHNKDVYFVPAVQRHFLDGIRYALGDLAADAVPSSKLATKPEPALAPDSGPTLQDLARDKFVAGAVSRLRDYRDGSPFGDMLETENLLRGLSAAERAEAEKAVVALLGENLAPEGRRAVIRILARTGDAGVVAALENAAKDPLFASDAATGLANIPDKAAETALIRLAAAGPESVRIAAINALASRRDPSAFPALAAVAAEDSPAGVAALRGLALAGTDAALKSLLVVKTARDTERAAALLAASDRILQSGQGDKAAVAAVCRDVLARNPGDVLRVSAARILLNAEGPGASAELLPLLKDPSAFVRRTAARTLALRGDDAAAAKLAEAVKGVDTVVAVAALAAAADSGKPALLTVAKAALDASASGLRARGAIAYVRCGGPDAVATVAPLLAGDAETAAGARTALGLPASETFGAAIRAALGASTDNALRTGLLAVLADRRDHAGFAVAASLTRESDAKLRQAAYETLAALAAPGDLAAVLETASGLKKTPDRRAWQKAVFVAAAAHPASAEAVKLLNDAIASRPATDVAVLIGALTIVPGRESGDALRALLARPEAEGRKEVIRALASARNRNARALLLETATKAVDGSERILALRGYLDTIAALDLKPAERVADYRAAWPLAGVEEKDTIVAAVKEIKSDEAKKFLKEIASDRPAPAAKGA